MSKRTTFTTITAIPPGVSRQAVLDALRNHESMINLNPLIKERYRIGTPPHAEADERNCRWFSLTGKLFGGLGQTDATFTCAFLDLPSGLQTHCYAPGGTDIRTKWTINGALLNEPAQPVEMGLGAPTRGLYLREDVDLRCNILTAGAVKKTLKNAHAVLIENLKVLAKPVTAGMMSNERWSASAAAPSRTKMGFIGSDFVTDTSKTSTSNPRPITSPSSSASANTRASAGPSYGHRPSISTGSAPPRPTRTNTISSMSTSPSTSIRTVNSISTAASGSSSTSYGTRPGTSQGTGPTFAPPRRANTASSMSAPAAAGTSYRPGGNSTSSGLNQADRKNSKPGSLSINTSTISKPRSGTQSTWSSLQKSPEEGISTATEITASPDDETGPWSASNPNLGLGYGSGWFRSPRSLARPESGPANSAARTTAAKSTTIAPPPTGQYAKLARPPPPPAPPAANVNVNSPISKTPASAPLTSNDRSSYYGSSVSGTPASASASTPLSMVFNMNMYNGPPKDVGSDGKLNPLRGPGVVEDEHYFVLKRASFANAANGTTTTSPPSSWSSPNTSPVLSAAAAARFAAAQKGKALVEIEHPDYPHMSPYSDDPRVNPLLSMKFPMKGKATASAPPAGRGVGLGVTGARRQPAPAPLKVPASSSWSGSGSGPGEEARISPMRATLSGPFALDMPWVA